MFVSACGVCVWVCSLRTYGYVLEVYARSQSRAMHACVCGKQAEFSHSSIWFARARERVFVCSHLRQSLARAQFAANRIANTNTQAHNIFMYTCSSSSAYTHFLRCEPTFLYFPNLPIWSVGRCVCQYNSSHTFTHLPKGTHTESENHREPHRPAPESASGKRERHMYKFSSARKQQRKFAYTTRRRHGLIYRSKTRKTKVYMLFRAYAYSTHIHLYVYLCIPLACAFLA